MKLHITALIALAVAVGLSIRGDPAMRADEAGPARFAWRGAGSCSAASCHGGDGDANKQGHEYAVWVARDPHARAYEVLFELRSKEIVKRLDVLADVEKAHPERDARCLKCHVDPSVASRANFLPVFHADGVSCESCHGPAQEWLREHYLPEWKEMNQAAKEAKGFRWTKDIAKRARVCTECHVGGAGREVNHDLIAAGHPRLAFEFADYQANYPKHWDPKCDKKRYADFEARSWAVGQIVSAIAAAKLLAARAAADPYPWPEFAEANCFSCHRDLRADSKGIGRLRLGDWYYAELPGALGVLTGPGGALDAHVSLYCEMAQKRPNKPEVAKLARELVHQLTLQLGAAESAPALSADRVQSALRGRLAAMAGIPVADWERAAQDYLGSKALNRESGDPQWAELLKKRREMLQLPAGLGGPLSAKKWRD